MKTIITTIGTSVFENYMDSEVRKAFRIANGDYPVDISKSYNRLRKRNCASELDAMGTEEKEIAACINNLWLKCFTKKNNEWIFNDGLNLYASAEIQSLCKIIKLKTDDEGETDKGKITDKIEIYLLCSDTPLSFFAGKLIKDALLNFFSDKLAEEDMYIEVIEGYNFGNSTVNTDEVFQNLVKILNRITAYKQLKPLLGKIVKGELKKATDYDDKLGNPNISDELKVKIETIKNKVLAKPKNSVWRDYLKEEIEKSEADFTVNVSGGYKGLVPYLTVIAQLWDMQIFYLFEDSITPVKIDRLPIQFDTSLIEQLYPYFDNDYLLSYESINQNIKAKEQLLKFKLANETPDGLLKISAFGKIFTHYVALKDYNDKSVFGFFAEYKFYEFFLENEYKGMTWVKHSRHIDNQGAKQEIDLQLSTIRDNGDLALSEGEFLLIEIKAFYRVYIDIEKIIADAKKRLMLYQNCFGMKPVEYILAIYKNDFNDMSLLRPILEKFKDEVSLEINSVKVIFTEIKIGDEEKSDTNVYKKFASEELTKYNVIDFFNGERLIQ